MEILIIHLSDMHFKSENNHIEKKREKLCHAVQDLASKTDETFLVISGDISYSGKEEEYVLAMEFIDVVKDHLKEYSTKRINCVVIPGNHDCNHEIDGKDTRSLVIKHIYENRGNSLPNEELIDQCCKVQDGFFSFLESYKNPDAILYTSKLLNIYKHDFDKFKVNFVCYNTSWMSLLSEQNEPLGRMYFPIKIFPREIFNYESDMTISVLHHPYNWQDAENSRELRNHIEKTSDIVLTGHEHIESKSVRDDLEGNLTGYIEGAVLQDNDDLRSGFNLIRIDLVDRQYKICQYKWDGDKYSSDDYSKDWVSCGTNKLKHAFTIRYEFVKELNDIGASFKHPNKQNLILEDFFVYPNLRDSNRESKDESLNREISESSILCELNESENRILLLGEEKSGKTSLCRMLYKNYYDKGYVPVYINGYNITDSSIEKFDKLLNKLYQEQYLDDNFESFNQLDKKRKVLVIDDFDRSRLNSTARFNLLNRISQYYTNIIITANNLFQIEEIVSDQKELIFDSYKKYDILQFGNLLRSKLIDKWNAIGIEQYISKNELLSKNDSAKLIMDMIIGNNFVPSYPIFLLTILQTIELGNPHDLRESAYGHYYQYLITQAISGIVKSDEIDSYYQYVTELANYLFEKDTREITKDEFVDFHRRYCDDYGISNSFHALINFDSLITNLLKTSIIEENKGLYKFKYRYIYYYFIARYISNNIEKEQIRQRITNMCKVLHIKEYANIVMFLTHHSKNSFILDEILNTAKSLFPDIKPVKFEEDISAINDLLREIPKLVFVDSNIEENRQTALKNKDKDMLESPDKDNIDESHELGVVEIENLDIISKLNSAFKIIEILGQILRNYCGSIKGDDRMSLGEEAYFIGLRSLGSLFFMFEQNKDYLVNKIKIAIEEASKTNKPQRKEDAEDIANGWLFGLCSMLAYGFIKKVSNSMGYEKLSETFKDILRKNDFISFRMIDTSIKLDFFRDFPYKDINDLHKKISKSFLPCTLLKLMVIEYLYMFPVDYDDKQRICDMLDIPINTQRRISITSTQKKR